MNAEDAVSPVIEIRALPGPDDCQICSYSRCPRRHRGLNLTSSSKTHYSFPWRRNSCSRDSCGFCIQITYLNFNSRAMEVYNDTFPDLGDIFRRLNEGLVSTQPAAKEMELALGKRLWTDQVRHHRVRDHEIADTTEAMSLYTQRLPTDPPVMSFFDNNGGRLSVFDIRVREKRLCTSEACGRNMEMSDQSSNELIGNLFILRESDWLQSVLNASMGTDLLKSCSVCYQQTAKSFDILGCPIILRILQDRFHLNLQQIFPQESCITVTVMKTMRRC